MKNDYKLQGAIEKIQVEIEKDVGEILAAMEQYTRLTKSEIVNTAIKRFISQHLDFMPPRKKAG